MATPTSTELLAQIDNAIATVTLAIVNGKTITEWKEGSISVKRESPAELLRALRDLRTTLSADDGSGRSASVGVCHGAV